MTDRRSPFRKLAFDVIRRVIRRAPRRRWSLRALRRSLVMAYLELLKTSLVAIPAAPRGVWYSALRDVTGGGVRDLVDARQLRLFDLGTRGRRRRPPPPVRKDRPTDAR